MTYFYARLLVLMAPILAWQAVELLVLPPNFFTFRPWEAVLVRNWALFRGPFYPNQDIEMWSAGDMNPRGHRGKHIRFRSDDCGYRNSEPYDVRAPYDLLLVGDSHMCGAYLHDRDTLATVLERKFDRRTYSYASGWPQCKAFLNDDRVWASPPRCVVFDVRPEDILHGRYGAWPECPPVDDSLQSMLCEPVSPWHRFLFRYASEDARVVYDRASKQLGYNFLRARMGLALRKPQPAVTLDQAHKNIEDFVAAMAGLKARLETRGVKFVVMLVPLAYPPGLGDYVAARLMPLVPLVHWHAGSPYAGDLTAEQCFEIDDSHMTKEGIARAAQRIVDLISERSLAVEGAPSRLAVGRAAADATTRDDPRP
jgi:hypothetical protein